MSILKKVLNPSRVDQSPRTPSTSNLGQISEEGQLFASIRCMLPCELCSTGRASHPDLLMPWVPSHCASCFCQWPKHSLLVATLNSVRASLFLFAEKSILEVAETRGRKLLHWWFEGFLDPIMKNHSSYWTKVRNPMRSLLSASVFWQRTQNSHQYHHSALNR